MKPYNQDDCPCCWTRDTRIRIVLHLLETHHWDYERGMDWLREREEAEVA